jgi:hypothetical protein
MQRRKFITLFGGAAAAAWPLVARAQQFRRIGVLMNTGVTDPSYVAVFVQALRKLGWIDGQNLRLDIQWHENNPERGRPRGSECCVVTGDSDCEAYTAIAWGVELNHGA